MATLYSKTDLYVFTQYMELCDAGLQALQVANPEYVNSTQYYINRWRLRVAINDAKNAVSVSNSISNAQKACTRGMYLVNNRSDFF